MSPLPMRSCRRLPVAAALIALALAVAALPALAAKLVLSPTTLEFTAADLAAAKRAQALYLTNTGSVAVRVQVRARHWEQDDGRDELEDTRDLAVSPAVIAIPAGERQLVRVLVSESARLEPGSEQAYRLLIDELPEDQTVAPDHKGLKFRLSYSLPVFVNTPADPATQLDVRWSNGRLRVDNEGQSRVRLSDLVWRNPDGSRVSLVPGLLGYVLAGDEMEWALPSPGAVVAGGQLLAVLGQNGEEQVVPLAIAD